MTANVRPVVCIAAAGKGTRVGTPWHKALLPINDKAIISHIIESFEPHVDIVIAVGHQKEVIKAYCKAAYPFRTITYVEVGNYDGEGSGPGFSMNCCREHLQRPFWFITCDCIAPHHEKWSKITRNWIGVCSVNDPTQYSTVAVDLDTWKVTDFINKSSKGYERAYIGFCEIKDYKVFWSAFDAYLANRSDKECEHIGVFYDLNQWSSVRLGAMYFSAWKDTGSLEGYKRAKQEMGKKQTYHFEKSIDEITYQLPTDKTRSEDGGRIIKLDHADKIAKKAHRAKLLKDIVPECVADGNILSYQWIDGKLLYEVDKAGVFLDFVHWCKDSMWSHKKCSDFKESCMKFYKDKTEERLAAFNVSFPNHSMIRWSVIENKQIDDKTIAWHEPMKISMSQVLARINWDWLSEGIPVIGHGDLNFGNALLVNPNMASQSFFRLIDWRETFAGQKDYIDVYYDLAKIYAGADVSWMKVHQHSSMNYLSQKQSCVSIHTDFYLRTPDLILFKDLYEKWIVDKGYDLKKVKTIAALIYLNMSPLHGKEMGEFLFFLALERLSNVTLH